MVVGVPKEVMPGERRVAVTPAGVQRLVAAGHCVLVQRDAGLACGHPDEPYAAAGAEIVESAEETWGRADLVTKVKQPVPEETARFHEGLVLFGYCQPATRPWLVDALLEQRVAAVAFEEVRLPNGERPLLRPMSEIAGRLAVLVAGQYLAEPAGRRGVLLGAFVGEPTARVLIIGGGAAGSAAAQAACGLGAAVTVLDREPDRVAPALAALLPAACLRECTEAALIELLPQADALINAVRWDPLTGRTLVTRDRLRFMPPGAVIVDIDCTPGGVIETTRTMTPETPTFVDEGVIHYCVPNMPATVPRTSTEALASATLPYLERIAGAGLDGAIKACPELGLALVCRDGVLLDREVAKAQGRA